MPPLPRAVIRHGLLLPTIDSLGVAVVITKDTSRVNVTGYGTFHIILVHRFVVLKAIGMLTNRLVHCDVPTLLTRSNAFNAPDPKLAQRLLYKTYQISICKLSVVFERRYLIVYDREAVFDALRHLFERHSNAPQTFA